MLSQIELIDAMNKIESLATAAQFLTANNDERLVQIELISIIEDLARQSQKAKPDSERNALAGGKA